MPFTGVNKLAKECYLSYTKLFAIATSVSNITMEGISFSSEDDSDDKESSKNKKKSAEAIGAFIVEPKAEAKPAKRESIWNTLLGRETEKAEKAESVTADKAELDEIAETEPLNELSADEKLTVEQQLVLGMEGEAETLSETDTNEAAEQAVEQFHAKILSEGQSSDEAFSETLEEIDGKTKSLESKVDEVTPTELPPHAVEMPIEFTDEPIEILRQPSSETIDSSPVEQAASLRPPVRPIFQPRPTFETATPAAAPETQTNVETDNGGLLVGGIVGYLIGRRRGRIRTERRLVPIQERLEKQVAEMQQNLLAKERVIRQAVIEKQQQGTVLEQTRATTQLTKTELNTERLFQAQTAAMQERPTEVPRPTVEKAAVEPIGTHVESLSRQDLLELAEKIIVDGTSLRTSFEANRITEKGLRRIIGEQLRGGDVKKALKLEMVEHEIDFERDPQVRDKSRHDESGTSGSAQLNTLLQQADPSAANDADYKRAALEAQSKHAAFEARQKHAQRRVLDVTMAIIITLLLMAIVGLVMARH